MLITLLLPAILLVVAALGERETQTQQAHDEALRTARSLAGRLNELISGTEQLLTGLSRAPDVRTTDTAACQRLLQEVRSQSPQYANFGVIELDGNVRCTALGLNGTKNLAGQRYFEQAKTPPRFAAGLYEIDGAAPGGSITFGYPILADDQEPILVLYASLDLAWLDRFVLDAAGVASTSTLVVDGQGTVLVSHPPTLATVGRRLPDAALVQALTDGRSSLRRESSDGVDRIHGIAPLRNTAAGAVYAGIPTSVALAGVEDRLVRNLSGLGVVALIGLSIAVVFSEFTILRKVGALLKHTERIRAGDLTARTHLRPDGGELDRLGHQFDQMAESLQDQRGRLELALERVKELDRLKTQFINTAAHELSTPLTPIRLQLYNLKNFQKDADPETLRKSLEVIERNFERLILLVRDVLDVARLQAGRLPLRPIPAELSQLVEEARESFRDRAQHAQVRLETDIPSGLRVVADPVRVHQVLFNLIENAIKFTPAGGAIRVTAEREGDWAVLRVHDSGAGMRRDQVARLFQPFSQVHEPQKFGGTGLGLFISKGIVEQHLGRIWADSPGPGQGSTFSFTLPREGTSVGVAVMEPPRDPSDTTPPLMSSRPSPDFATTRRRIV